jgi:hypothetical protein
MITSTEDLKIPSINPFSGMTAADLQSKLSGFDATGMLKGLGFNEEDSAKILEGDTSMIAPRIFNKLMILDLDTTLKNHAPTLSRDACSIFLDHAVKKTPFTDEEVAAFSTIYHKMFRILFEVGADFTYSFDEYPDALNLLVRADDEHYQFTRYHDDELILHLPGFDPSQL